MNEDKSWEQQLEDLHVCRKTGEWTAVVRLIRTALSQARQSALEEAIEKITKDIYVPAEKPRPNSEYHVGFNECQTRYAESKIKTIEAIRKLTI